MPAGSPAWHGVPQESQRPAPQLAVENPSLAWCGGLSWSLLLKLLRRTSFPVGTLICIPAPSLALMKSKFMLSIWNVKVLMEKSERCLGLQRTTGGVHHFCLRSLLSPSTATSRRLTPSYMGPFHPNQSIVSLYLPSPKDWGARVLFPSYEIQIIHISSGVTTICGNNQNTVIVLWGHWSLRTLDQKLPRRVGCNHHS